MSPDLQSRYHRQPVAGGNLSITAWAPVRSGTFTNQPTAAVDDFPKCARHPRPMPRRNTITARSRYCPYKFPMNRFFCLVHVGPRAQWRATLAFVSVFFSKPHARQAQR